MDLHLLFKGKLGREDLASALLATLLEQRNDVRSTFFDLLTESVGQAVGSSFKDKRWRVLVEKDAVDIRLEAGGKQGAWVILIENKIQAGSKQPDQLLRYYRTQIQNEPDARVVAVYLAPDHMGSSEIEGVKRELKPGHFGIHVPWSSVLDCLDNSKSDPDGLTSSLAKEIRNAIKNAATQKYPHVGKRRVVHDAAWQVRDDMEAMVPSVEMGVWTNRDNFTLCSRGTNVTLWFVLHFEAEEKNPYLPVRLFDGQRMRLTIWPMLKLSAKGRRDPKLKSSWLKRTRTGKISVPGVGVHELNKGNGWFEFERQLSEPPGQMVKELTNMGVAVLHWINKF